MHYDLEDVKAIPIVDVFKRLGYTVPESKYGRVKMKCPFHEDKDPSLSIDPDKNLFHCFGCQAGGSNIDAVIESRQAANVGDAIKWLGESFDRRQVERGDRPATLYNREDVKLEARKAARAAEAQAGVEGVAKIVESDSFVGPEPDYQDKKSGDLRRSFTLGSAYGLFNFIKDMQSDPDGLALSFPGSQGNKLDEMLSLEAGTLSIIAGRPGHGKTTFMINALMNMLRAYPTKAFLYLTYEETKKGLAFRVVRILAAAHAPENNPSSNINFEGMRDIARNFNELSVTSDADKAIGKPCPDGCPPNVWTALAEYNDLTASWCDKGARVFLIDAHCYDGARTLDLVELDNLFYIVNEHCKSGSMFPVGAIFLDYAQKIPPPPQAEGRARYSGRQHELQDVSNRLLQLAKHENIPVIIGAQVNREVSGHKKKSESGKRVDTGFNSLTLDKMREAGDFEQDAATVIGLWHSYLAASERDGSESPTGRCPLGVKILKNRNGRVSNFEFTFNVSTGYITGDKLDSGTGNNAGGVGFD